MAAGTADVARRYAGEPGCRPFRRPKAIRLGRLIAGAQRLIQRLEKKILPPHYRFIDSQLLFPVVDAAFEDALPLRISLGQVILAKGAQDAAGRGVVEASFDAIRRELCQL